MALWAGTFWLNRPKLFGFLGQIGVCLWLLLGFIHEQSLIAQQCFGI